MTDIILLEYVSGLTQFGLLLYVVKNFHSEKISERKEKKTV